MKKTPQPSPREQRIPHIRACLPKHSKIPCHRGAPCCILLSVRSGTKNAGKSDAEGATDAELVRAARRGDKRAFVEIVARHQAMVCGISYSILCNFAASEDAAQEAFLTAWRKFHDLREPERLRSWLGQIARNAALGHLRRDKGNAPLQDAPEPIDSSPGPDEAVANTEEAALVRESLSRLPEIYRLPLILYYREGKSVRAVAESLAISEDAVKQRLSRGRDMLREQVSTVIESVLTRTGPTAIFTMAVAVAVGALAAPAAIAAGVFSATAMAGSASAANTSTPILTAMSTSKGLLVTAAVVTLLSIPIGYKAGASKSSTTNTAASAPVETPVVATRATPSFENSALFAEWRKLHEKYGTNAAAMPVLYKAISEIKDAMQRRAFKAALLSEWVQVDPPSGLGFLLNKGHDQAERKEFFLEWLETDPRAAVDALVTSGNGWEQLARESLVAIAKSLPARVPAIVSQLPAPENFWDSSVRQAFAIVAGDNLDQARAAALGLNGPNREQALAGVASAWAKSDPQASINWAKSLPDGTDKAELIRSALVGLAGVNPTAALEQVGIVPPGGKQSYFASTTGARVLEEAVKADFDGTVAWLAANPGKLTREDLLGMAGAVTDRLNADPSGFLTMHAADGSLASILPAIGSALLNGSTDRQGAVWDWLKTQPESETTKNLRQDVINAMAWQSPGQALKLVGDLPAGAEGDSQVKQLAQSLLNGGSMMYRLDTLYSQAPARLQQPLLETAFSMLRGDNLDDPQTWIARLPLLSESSQSSGAVSIARAWAERSPEDAIAWIQSMPADTTRSGAAAAIASTWAATDPRDATQWVSAMAAGPERDQTSKAIAFALSETDPRDAWNLALGIADPAQRDAAAAHVSKMMAIRDLATARQWIEAGPFTPERKAQLQASLNNSASTGP